jgi:TPP-dependent pyruvate/acetoin dehydrogenase alpha subunit/pyruvate/2-oxoglutarate/acetoin dehydrogenase E1 component
MDFAGTLEELVYRTLRIRLVEERIAEIYPSDVIQSPVHLSIGQEPVAVAACARLSRDDRVFGGYRSHAYYLAKGGDLSAMLAELYGRATGCGRGKAGSMHLASPDVNVMGSSAVVASTISHAVGAAFAAKQLGDGRVTLCVFGDGATEEGVYHESLNFAALHELPILFLCENNGLAIHSRLSARQSYAIADHARSYGLPVTRCDDGHDLLGLYDVFGARVERIREGVGPQFVEVETYRYREHVGPLEDYDAGYRTRAELEKWQARDPLFVHAEIAERFRPDIEREIDAAVRFAESSPPPRPDALLAHVIPPHTPPPAPAAPAGVLTYGAALGAAMRDALESRPETVILGQGVDDHRGIFGTTLGLADAYGGRVLDVPLAEEGLTGIGVGAALGGLYPIQTHIRADFALLAMNQIVNLAAKYHYMFGGAFEVPMLIRLVIGRSWGQGSQHSQSIQSLLAHIPGLSVLMPASAQSVLESYASVVGHHRGPVLSLEHRLLYGLEFDLEGPIDSDGPLGSRTLRRGGDVTVVATSIMVIEALRAAEHLQREAGIDCDVIDLHNVSQPGVERVLSSVRRTGRLVVADTSWQAYGVASEVCRWVAESDPAALRAPVRTLGMQPSPCPTAKALEDLFYPTLTTLCDAIATVVSGREDHGLILPDETSMTETYRHFKGPF